MADSLSQHFVELPDPRNARGRLHKLVDIVVVSVLAFICGADDWTEVAVFGKSKEPWLKTFLDLPWGIPSHDTFGDLFARLDPDAFEACITSWSRSLTGTLDGKLVAIDGKAIRRSFEHAWNKNGCVHLVSAFVAQNQAVFGQIAVDNKSNEITAIAKLIDLLDLRGATVTIDAIGCQKQIAGKILEKKADYLLSVKGNQPTLQASIEAFMQKMTLTKWADVPHDFVQTVDGDHGRIETRRVWVTDEVDWLNERSAWPGLRSIAKVEATRDDPLKGVSVETRLYISSLAHPRAAAIAARIRGHWSVENQLHWQLDVSFGEDQSRARKGHAAENQSRLRRLALMQLKQDSTFKVGIKAKRKAAGWSQDYLLTLLNRSARISNME